MTTDRYPGDHASPHNMNRLLATLEEVARTVSRAVADAPPSQPVPQRESSSAAMADTADQLTRTSGRFRVAVERR